MKELPHHLQSVIEKICCKGCAEVHRLIRDIEDGKRVDELTSISNTEKRHVVSELKDIMQVYQRCRAG